MREMNTWQLDSSKITSARTVEAVAGMVAVCESIMHTVISWRSEGGWSACTENCRWFSGVNDLANEKSAFCGKEYIKHRAASYSWASYHYIEAGKTSRTGLRHMYWNIGHAPKRNCAVDGKCTPDNLSKSSNLI